MILLRALRLFALAALATFASQARAEWYEASSDHFVIYADDSEKDIRRFAANLEKYHLALEYLVRTRLQKPSPSNRVVIFVVGSGGELRNVFGKGSTNVAGFYVPRAGASRAFVQDIRNKNGYPDFSTIVLLHEYAHHFLISSSRFAMPRWMSEGMAEFFASAGFPKNGGVLIGRPAQHRVYEISQASRTDVWDLLRQGSFDARRKRSSPGFYGRSWLLYHYLYFNPERRGQIDAYVREILSGQSSLDAGEAAFGDLGKLDSELMSYKRRRSFNMLEVPCDLVSIPEISLRRLSEGEGKVMPLRMRSQRGVTRDQAEELVLDVRKVAARYPDDPGVLAALAEAEYDAGNDDAAIAAADRAITLDPSRVNAYVQKGYALFRLAKDASDEDQDAAYKRAMEPFTALNQIENDHPLPLIYYYRSYAQRGIAPPENARLALENAALLAPFDQSLWFDVALLQMQEGKIELARNALQPLAFDPHGGSKGARMRELMDLLEKAPEGKPITASVLASARQAAGGDLEDTTGGDGAGGDGSDGSDGSG
ncbi:MAG: DUF1570 domain-containing protein [Pseudomonadota bacterium]